MNSATNLMQAIYKKKRLIVVQEMLERRRFKYCLKMGEPVYFFVTYFFVCPFGKVRMNSCAE